MRRSNGPTKEWARALAFGALAAIALSGCGPTVVHSYLERGVDLKRYHTYSWGPADTWSTGDPRLDNNRFFDERVRARVELELQQRGFEKTASSEPDLNLHYHASVSQDIQEPERDHRYTCPPGDCGPQIYEKGTLVIDLVDPRTKKVVWRGWAEASMEGVVDNQSWMEARIDEAVAKILARLPRT